MRINATLFLLLIILFSCSDDNEALPTDSLQEYININSTRILDEVIACAGSKKESTDVSYIFYYPINGAIDIRYYETENVNENDFSQYKRKILPDETIFGGKLERFIRTEKREGWCIVTFLSNGKFHKSNPIRLKNNTKPTEWITEVIIDNTESLQPKFLWSDGVIAENTIYFQVISDKNDFFLSGTYTYEKNFQYFNTSNVVLSINTSTPPTLILDNKYNFILMGVSEDNWINLVIKKPFNAK